MSVIKAFPPRADLWANLAFLGDYLQKSAPAPQWYAPKNLLNLLEPMLEHARMEAMTKGLSDVAADVMVAHKMLIDSKAAEGRSPRQPFIDAAERLKRHGMTLMARTFSAGGDAVVLGGDLEKDALRALLKLRAFDSDSRVTAEKVALTADPRGTSLEKYKRPLGSLKDKGLVESQRYRGGGFWLTPAGRKRAESLS
jgi:hypothetical protein